MKQLRFVLVMVIVLGSLAWSLSAIAQGPPGPLRGEITEVTDTAITIYTSEGEYVVVNLSAETQVYDLLTQTEGSVADLTKLTTVEVMGRPSEEGPVDAWMIVITPWGDLVRGEITVLDLQQGTITVENRMPMRGPDDIGPEEDSAQVGTVAVSEATQVLINGEESQASDLTVGQFVTAYGETQADGSLVATVVIVSDEPQGFGLGPGPGGPGPGEPGEPGPGGPGEHPGPGGPPEGGGQRPGGMEQ